MVRFYLCKTGPWRAARGLPGVCYPFTRMKVDIKTPYPHYSKLHTVVENETNHLIFYKYMVILPS